MSPFPATPKTWKVDPETGCWLWEGSFLRGRAVNYTGGTCTPAARALWSAVHVPVPTRIQLKCVCPNNLKCVSPNHWVIRRPKDMHAKLGLSSKVTMAAQVALEQHGYLGLRWDAREPNKLNQEPTGIRAVAEALNVPSLVVYAAFAKMALASVPEPVIDQDELEREAPKGYLEPM